MKKVLFAAAALALLSAPVLAQQSATGQSSGGPAVPRGGPMTAPGGGMSGGGMSGGGMSGGGGGMSMGAGGGERMAAPARSKKMTRSKRSKKAMRSRSRGM